MPERKKMVYVQSVHQMPERKKIVYVQSVLPVDVVLDLKKKTGESSIHQALHKAIYHYLKCEKEKEAAERPG